MRFVSLVVAATLVAGAWAQEKDAKSCCKKDGASAKSCCQKSGDAAKAGCSEKDAAACKDMPKMSYVVGDKSVCCPMEAEKLASGDKAKIQYRVGEKTFAQQSEAQVELAAALDGYLTKITTVQYAVGDECMACPMSAEALAKKAGKPVQYRLASFNFSDKAMAEKVSAEAKAAAEKVQMQQMVDGKAVSCSGGAAVAKSDGKSEYCVGDAKTCCPIQAKTMLAQARVEAAMKVIAAANNS